ncbi:MAG: glycerol-3-phosphate dehydrogenase [Micavibrio sp.]
MTSDYDLLIIGGGVNGAGIARDAAGRGMSVLLVEAQDLAGATSSASTKLIHGGLRYLEYFEFNLVRAALKEREVLLGLAPHIIWPLDFVLPYWPSLRPAWMIRLGLYLYDHLGGGLERLKKSSALDLNAHAYGMPLQPAFKKGFRYADCWVQDSRLVVLNALDAAELGAHILTRTACTGLRVVDGHWEAELRDVETNEMLTRTAGMVVNAAGPWVHSVLEGNNLTRKNRTPNIRLVKGSHIIVPKVFEGEQAYILQQPDRRIVFAIPYERNFTLIGTTDVDYTGDPARPVIDAAEKDYLCAAVNRYFKKSVTVDDIVHTYSGVRPLMDDGRGKAAEVTRDYHLEMELSFGAPLLSVFGGKITTYRHLAEDAVDKLVPHWSRANENPASQMAWTDTVTLPGGDMLNGDFDGFLKDQLDRYDWLPEPLVRRYARAYGTRMDRLLEGAVNLNSLGRHFGDDLYQAEIDYLIKKEWAKTAEDILWRRSKLGLHLSKATQAQLNDYMVSRQSGGRMAS